MSEPTTAVESEPVSAGFMVFDDEDAPPSPEPTPEPEPKPEPPAKETAPETPPAPEDPDDDLEEDVAKDLRVDRQTGARLVPVSHLTTERQRRQKAEGAIKQLSDFAAWAKANPHVIAAYERGEAYQPPVPAPSPASAPKPAAPAVSEALYERVAKAYGLYDLEGKPDRALIDQQIALMREVSSEVAGEKVAPFQQQQTAARAHEHLAVLRQAIPQAGVEPAVLDEIASLVPAEIMADPQAAMLVFLASVGAGVVRKGPTPPSAPAPAPQPERKPIAAPIFTETQTPPRGKPEATLSDVERNLARSLRIGTDKWQKLGEGFKAGEFNAFDDEDED